jgi:hypothetical protein
MLDGATPSSEAARQPAASIWRHVHGVAWLALACLAPLALAAWTGLKFPPKYDEPAHKAFAEYLSRHPVFDTIATYKGSQNYEAKGPLYFLLASLWGRLAGFGLIPLRLLTLALSIIGIVAFQRLLRLLPGPSIQPWTALLPCLPYFLAMSVTFMTDVPNLTLIILGLLGYLSYISSGNAIQLPLGALCLTCAAYIRVEALYVLPAIAVACWLHKTLDRKLFLSLAIPIVARLPLVFVWGGLAAPPAQARPNVVFLDFSPAHLVFTLAVVGLYFWPTLLAPGVARCIARSRWFLVIALAVVLACVAFTPRLVPNDVESYGGTIRSFVMALKLSPYLLLPLWVVFSLLGLGICWHVAAENIPPQNAIVTSLGVCCAIGVLMQAARGPVMYERYLLEVTPFFLSLLLMTIRSHFALLLWAIWSLGLQIVQLAKNGMLER